jgi:hypothetical protein
LCWKPPMEKESRFYTLINDIRDCMLKLIYWGVPKWKSHKKGNRKWNWDIKNAKWRWILSYRIYQGCNKRVKHETECLNKITAELFKTKQNALRITFNKVTCEAWKDEDISEQW